jgi:16S rRNA (adenine1518-N6/adenine1519-N6)-dimethyltransferase
MAETDRAQGPGAVLREHGLRPRKRLGQNFLQDRRALARIVAALQPEAADDVLEIGAGTGVLTRALAQNARRVIAVELDDALQALLREDLAELENVEVWHGNALAFDACEHFAGHYKLAGNIPYYVTGPIIRYFLEAKCQPSVLVLMVQKEVAERIVASPGRLSLLGVSVQYYARTEIVTRVPAGAFHPRPKVDSAVIRLVPYRPARTDGAADFFAVARAGFSSRRKQLGNSLRSGLDLSREDTNRILHEASVDPARRAETLSIGDWERVSAAWRALGRAS